MNDIKIFPKIKKRKKQKIQIDSFRATFRIVMLLIFRYYDADNSSVKFYHAPVENRKESSS